MSMSDTSLVQSSSPPDTEHSPVFYVVSIKKLVVMTLMTMGCYHSYWFYRNWKLYRAATNETPIALVRAAVPALFIYSLCNKVDGRIRDSGRTFSWSPLAMLVSYTIPVLVSFLMLTVDVSEVSYVFAWQAGMLAFSMGLQLYALISIQRAINFNEEDVHGQSNSSFTEANALWIAVGMVYWVITLMFVWGG